MDYGHIRVYSIYPSKPTFVLGMVINPIVGVYILGWMTPDMRSFVQTLPRINGSFPKCWYPTTMFPTKYVSFWGVFMGGKPHHLRKHPPTPPLNPGPDSGAPHFRPGSWPRCQTHHWSRGSRVMAGQPTPPGNTMRPLQKIRASIRFLFKGNQWLPKPEKKGLISEGGVLLTSHSMQKPRCSSKKVRSMPLPK